MKCGRRTHVASLLTLLCVTAPLAALADTRVATLLPAVEDALRGVDGVTVVAGVRRSFRAPERTDVIDLGNPHSPNVERLAQTGADIVVGDLQTSGHLKASLGRFGAEVFLVDTTSVEATLRDLEALGAKVGAGDELAARVGAAREALASQHLAEPVEVLALFGTPGSFQVVTGKAWLGSLLTELGFVNVAADATGSQRFPGFVEVSHEYLATLRPELVVLVAHGDPAHIQGELRSMLSGGGPWAALDDAATRGVHVLSPERFLANPGLALPDAAQALVALADGEKSGDVAGEAATPAVGSAP